VSAVPAAGAAVVDAAAAFRRRAEIAREFPHAWAGGLAALTVRVPTAHEAALLGARFPSDDPAQPLKYFRALIVQAVVGWVNVVEHMLVPVEPEPTGMVGPPVPFAPDLVPLLLDANPAGEAALRDALADRILARNARVGDQQKN